VTAPGIGCWRTPRPSQAVGEVVWEVSVDSTGVRAHQHAAGARKQLARPERENGGAPRPGTRRSGGAVAG